MMMSHQPIDNSESKHIIPNWNESRKILYKKMRGENQNLFEPALYYQINK